MLALSGDVIQCSNRGLATWRDGVSLKVDSPNKWFVRRPYRCEPDSRAPKIMILSGDRSGVSQDWQMEAVCFNAVTEG